MKGHSAKEAKIKAGAPCGEHNIRKRANVLIDNGRKRLKLEKPMQLKRLKSAFNLSSSQKDRLQAQNARLATEGKAAFKKVCVQWDNIVKSKAGGDDTTEFPSIDEVIANENAQLGIGVPRVKKSTVYRFISEGKAGISPGVRGPRSKVPRVITDAAESFAATSQVAGDEKRRSDLGQHMMAAALGTEHEGSYTERACKSQLKKRSSLETAAPAKSDERRWAWTTWDNVNDWFTCWKPYLVKHMWGELDI